MVSRATSKYICNKATAGVSKEHQGWEQKRYSKKNDEVEIEERLKQ